MKNKSLVTIILVSIVTFAALVFSLYKFVLKEKTVFYSDGYVSITDSDVPEKAYFIKGTEYKKGYSDDVIFTSKDDKKTVASIYSFAFYNDKSISFLNDGVLMPLDDLNEKYLSYYNIKSKYLINYKDDRYLISSKNKDITFSSFIGRISDTKYIVAGKNLKLKLTSSENMYENYYFEFEFIDGGLVRITNETLNIETIASECYILTPDNVKVDLDKRIISVGNETKLNLSEIVINSDQNIDILYDDKKNDDNTGNTTVKPNKPNITVEDRYQVETVVDYKKAPYVRLLSSNVNSHKIDINFDVIDDNNLITSSVYAKLLNVKTGDVIDLKEYKTYGKINEYIYDGLKSNSKYILTIYASYKGNSGVVSDYVLFQRTFNTSEIGALLELDYKNSNSLSYNINVSKTSTFTSGTLNLYDEKGSVVDSYRFENKGQKINHTFNNLNPNKKYIAKIEDITYGSISYPDGNAASVTSSTLKVNPFKDTQIMPSVIATVNKKDYTVSIKLENVVDPNNSIKKVIYNIYDEGDNLVKTITKDKPLEEVLKFEKPLEKNKNYYVNAIISINDNEKNIDYRTENSPLFNMNNLQAPTISAKNIYVSASTVTGEFTIYDPDNTIDKTKNIYVEYKNMSSGDVATIPLTYTDCSSSESETTKCASINLSMLKSSTKYTLDLYAYYDLKDEEKPAGVNFVDRTLIFTTEANVVKTNMESITLTDEEAFKDIFNVNVNLEISKLIDESITADVIKENFKSFEIELCEGTLYNNSHISSINVTENIIADYFDGTKKLTLADFGYTLDMLRERHKNGIISKNYVIFIKNGISGNDSVVFDPGYLEFRINDSLLVLASGEATIEVTQIPNAGKDENLKDDTTIGLKITPILKDTTSENEEEVTNNNSIKKYIKKINYKIYDITNGKDEANTLKITDELELTASDNLPEKTLYFSDYEFLKRGHIYVVEYTLSLKFTPESDELLFPFNKDDLSKNEPVTSENINVLKEVPTVYMFAWESAENFITYKYEIIDKDKAINNNDFNLYYSVNEDEVINPSESVTCPKPLRAYNASAYKCAKINNLNNADNYKIHVNVKLIESDTYESSYALVNEKVFNGISPLEMSYNILKTENKLMHNNLLIMKLTGQTSKVASYNLILSDGNSTFKIENINNNKTEGFLDAIGGNKITYTKGSETKTWNYTGYDKNNDLLHTAYIGTCEEDLCLYLDYSKLYYSSTFGSVFESYKNKNITVTLEGLYDTGKVGFLGNTSKKYAFVKSETGEYVLLFDRNFTLSQNAIGAYYPFTSGGYFVDDDEPGAGSNTYVNNDYFIGNIYFKNLASRYFANKNEIFYERKVDYKVNEKGVTIYLNKDYEAIDIKELGTSEISTLDNMFTYENVVPSLKINLVSPTINGAKINMQISGIKESDIDNEDNVKYLYLEVGNNTLKINKDELTSQSGVVSGNSYVIKTYSNYLLNLKSVKVDNKVVSDYKYDYLTKTIKFNDEEYSGKKIDITYEITLYGLDINTEYTMKAYMMISGKKVYLTDSSSTLYETFNYPFKTLSEADVKVTDASFDINSKDDYSQRLLNLNYNISDIIGIKSVDYEICADGVCATNIQNCSDDNYNVLGGSTCAKSNKYDMSASFDITGDSFVFGKDYQTKLTAKVDTPSGEKEIVIYNSGVNARSLNAPNLDVIKASHYNTTSGYYLNFRIAFNDPDKVVTSGNYKAYLATLQNGEYKVVSGSEEVKNIFSSNNKARYNNLEENKQYYFIIEYDTYINNNGTTALEHHFDRYLMFTLNNYHINTGLVQYMANNYVGEDQNIYGETTLRFGYAANIMKDIVPVEPDEDYVEQEAYVVGITYAINSIESSVGNIYISGTKMFDELSTDEDDKIIYITGSTESSVVGDSYYQILLRHNGTKGQNANAYAYTDELLLRSAGYNIVYKFYLGGAITKDLNTEEKCIANAASNKWNADKNECYILGSENNATTRTEDKKRG